MDEIILVGAGGHARSCVDVIELSRQFKIAGFIEKDETNSQGNLGYPIITTDDDLKELRKKYSYALITVGQIKPSNIRVKLFQLLMKLDYTQPVIISPRAYVSKHAQIGDGSIIMHDSIVNANAKIGKNCIINNKTLIEHDAIIGDHCHIATGAIVNGEVTVGSKSLIGSGVVTIQCISIGSNCTIGAGVVLKSDIESNQIIRK
jgi:sugar O-acyltransferase (sialic acid O-acetyltransferase NeuD family)